MVSCLECSVWSPGPRLGLLRKTTEWAWQMAGGSIRKSLSHSLITLTMPWHQWQGWVPSPSKVCASCSSPRESKTGRLHGDLTESERPIQSEHHVRPLPAFTIISLGSSLVDVLMPICLICSVARSLKLEHAGEMSYKVRNRASGRHQDWSLKIEEEATIYWQSRFRYKSFSHLEPLIVVPKYSM